MTASPSPSSNRNRVRVRRRVLHSHQALPKPTIVPGRIRRRVLISLAAFVIATVFAYDIGGMRNLRQNPVIGADYNPTAKYIADRRKDGEVVITALPPPAFLALETRDNLVFLPSPLERERAQRYTRVLPDGRYVDYWTGSDSIVDVAGLCSTILNSPKVWLLVDSARLRADWAYGGDMEQVIRGMTYIQYEAEGGAQVRRLSPAPARNPYAEGICDSALTGTLLPEVTPTVAPPVIEQASTGERRQGA